jgi:hypothetical protein
LVVFLRYLKPCERPSNVSPNEEADKQLCRVCLNPVTVAGNAPDDSMHGRAASQGIIQHQNSTACAILHAHGEEGKPQRTPAELKVIQELSRLLKSGPFLPSRKVPQYNDTAMQEVAPEASQPVVQRLTDIYDLHCASKLSFTEFWCALCIPNQIHHFSF